jgi:hypothetical protein
VASEASCWTTAVVRIDTKYESVAVEDGTERGDLSGRIDHESEVGESVTGAIVIEESCDEEGVVLQTRIRVVD